MARCVNLVATRTSVDRSVDVSRSDATRGDAACYSLLNELQAYWKLNEASGYRLDSYGLNTLTDTNSVGQATGKIENAASFVRASNQYLSHVDNAALRTGSVSFSMSFWLYPTDITTLFETVATKNGGAGQREWELFLYPSTQNSRLSFLTRNIGDTAWFEAIFLLTLVNNTWYHVYAEHNLTTGANGISVNNGAMVTTPFASSSVAGNGDFMIGRSFGAERLSARVDEFGFWKKPLTTTQRTYLYNSGNARTFAEISAYIGQ